MLPVPVFVVMFFLWLFQMLPNIILDITLVTISTLRIKFVWVMHKTGNSNDVSDFSVFVALGPN